MAQNQNDAGSVSEALDRMVRDLLGAYLDALAEGEDPGGERDGRMAGG